MNRRAMNRRARSHVPAQEALVDELHRRGLYLTSEACDASGATYRQADHARRTERIVPSHRGQGSGDLDGWSLDDVTALAALTALREALAHHNAALWTDLEDRLIAATYRGDPIWIHRDGPVELTLDLADIRANVTRSLPDLNI